MYLFNRKSKYVWSAALVLFFTVMAGSGFGESTWEARPSSSGKETGYSCRIVDYGDDYTHYRTDQFIFAPLRGGVPVIKMEGNLDLDGDGKKNDSLSYVEFNLDEATVPNPRVPSHYDWDNEGINARIYIARTAYLLNEQRNCIMEGGGPNVDHSLGADDLNMMGWSPKLGYMAGGKVTRGWGTWLWKKIDFLNWGDRYRVSFDDKSMLSLHLPRYCTPGIKAIRYLVQDGEQFYLSEFSFVGGEGITHILRPTKTRWAKYNPKPPHDIEFDSTQAIFEPHAFSDIRFVGYHAEADWCGNYWLKIGAFEVIATVHRPTLTSVTLNMKKIPGAAGIPEFEMSATEIPYACWQKVYRAAVATGFTINPGYYFDKEADMGSMAYGGASHQANEPATDITWLDAVAWCNALSEQEGKEPVYYVNAECTEVFRRTQERFLIDFSDWITPERKQHSGPVSSVLRMHYVEGEKNLIKTNESYTPYVPRVYVKWEADGYRLPTLAEWTLAAEGDFRDGVVPTAPSNSTQPVGSGKSNTRMVYDMAGNVWEYCWDIDGDYNPQSPGWTGAHTVLGGDFHGTVKPGEMSASARGDQPFLGSYNIGFRVVCRSRGASAPLIRSADYKNIPKWSFDRKTRLAPRNNPPKAMPVAMIAMNGGQFYYQPSAGNADLSEITISPFDMGTTEITYAQWKEIYDWAIVNGYSFNYDGDMGSMYREVGAHTHSPTEPVTRISWFDAKVWCNAKSEKEGLKPCYYLGDTIMKKSMPLRHPQEFRIAGAGRLNNILNSTYSSVRVDWSADGYRLPTLMENLIVSSVTKPGARPMQYWESGTPDEHAWTLENSGGTTHEVGKKSPSPSGFYDLYGNAEEMCNDAQGPFNSFAIRNPKLGNGVGLVCRGGSFIHPRTESSMGPQVDSSFSFYGYPNIGFRIVRCPYVPTITIADKKYAVVGEYKDKVKAGAAIAGTAEIDEKNRTIRIISVEGK